MFHSSRRSFIRFTAPAQNRGRRKGWSFSWLGSFLISLLLALAGRAFAHNLDTSYARVTITPQEVEFKFAYDLASLQRITRLDPDGDLQVSRAEIVAATPAIQQFLRARVFLGLNEQEAEFAEAVPPVWPEDAGAAIPESDYHQRLLSFAFRNPVLSAPEAVTLTFDVFGQLGDAHTILGVFVWEGREDEVIFTRFEPDYLYDTGYRTPLSQQITQYFKLGVKHIFLGFDHIAFLFALLFVKRFMDLIKVITAFTVAHTLTLALAVLQIVKFPSQLVEIGIAATIMYVAAENLWVKSTRHRWMLTFGFGLVHGFGFANVLRELGLPARGLARSLVSFNLGVEAGQIVIVGALWPLLWWINRQSWAAAFRVGLSVVIFLLGAAWFVERTFRLKFMPI
jgi:hypothetical protein